MFEENAPRQIVKINPVLYANTDSKYGGILVDASTRARLLVFVVSAFIVE